MKSKSDASNDCNLKAKASKPTSAAILLLAYSIRMGPRSEDSRKEPCAGDRSQGKLCNKNTTSAAQCRGTTANYRMCEGSTHSECALDNRADPHHVSKKRKSTEHLLHMRHQKSGEVETEVLASRSLTLL
jgi:hypothetical protein